ncbi:hypothetical protein A4X13_0g7200 [Tilletia indica]|uniref:Uncharacterized protein n=1 Tax=Tilletia indica TaxID=43049 RepID=A0A177TSK5_9BASI|nr:hypothetical protein A4X13_0g7200 [Tilletia indica]
MSSKPTPSTLPPYDRSNSSHRLWARHSFELWKLTDYLLLSLAWSDSQDSQDSLHIALLSAAEAHRQALLYHHSLQPYDPSTTGCGYDPNELARYRIPLAGTPIPPTLSVDKLAAIVRDCASRQGTLEILEERVLDARDIVRRLGIRGGNASQMHQAQALLDSHTEDLVNFLRSPMTVVPNDVQLQLSHRTEPLCQYVPLDSQIHVCDTVTLGGGGLDNSSASSPSPTSVPIPGSSVAPVLDRPTSNTSWQQRDQAEVFNPCEGLHESEFTASSIFCTSPSLVQVKPLAPLPLHAVSMDHVGDLAAGSEAQHPIFTPPTPATMAPSSDASTQLPCFDERKPSAGDFGRGQSSTTSVPKLVLEDAGAEAYDWQCGSLSASDHHSEAKSVNSLPLGTDTDAVFSSPVRSTRGDAMAGSSSPYSVKSASNACAAKMPQTDSDRASCSWADMTNDEEHSSALATPSFISENAPWWRASTPRSIGQDISAVSAECSHPPTIDQSRFDVVLARIHEAWKQVRRLVSVDKTKQQLGGAGTEPTGTDTSPSLSSAFIALDRVRAALSVIHDPPIPVVLHAAPSCFQIPSFSPSKVTFCASYVLLLVSTLVPPSQAPPSSRWGPPSPVPLSSRRFDLASRRCHRFFIPALPVA